uniref:Large ribosomal subunit protein bL20c n=1 Tax=Opuntia streptacantha TaxID=393608 RepID=A0A7C9D9K3_OPUST
MRATANQGQLAGWVACFVIRQNCTPVKNKKRNHTGTTVHCRSNWKGSTFQGDHPRVSQTIAQKKIRALILAHWVRERQTRDFRHLWIQINPVIRESPLLLSDTSMPKKWEKRRVKRENKKDRHLHNLSVQQ